MKNFNLNEMTKVLYFAGKNLKDFVEVCIEM